LRPFARPSRPLAEFIFKLLLLFTRGDGFTLVDDAGFIGISS